MQKNVYYKIKYDKINMFMVIKQKEQTGFAKGGVCIETGS